MHIFTYCISFLRFQENTEETLGLSFHYLNLRGFICRKWHLLLRRMSVRSWGAGMVSYFSCVWLCDPMDCNLPGSSVHGILQARLLEWVAIPFSRESSWPRDWTCVSYVSCIDGWVLYHWRHLGSPAIGVKWSEVTQWCPTLCNPMDCSLPGSSVHGILQARILEWVALSCSRGSSQPRDRTWVSCIAGRRFTIWATREAIGVGGANFLTALISIGLPWWLRQ